MDRKSNFRKLETLKKSISDYCQFKLESTKTKTLFAEFQFILIISMEIYTS